MTLLSKASLVATPTAYGDGVLNSVKPTDGAGDFDFARASSATRVNEEGLIEKERENLLLQSNQFDTTWTNTSSTETGGQTGYDGTTDAWLIERSNAYGNIFQAQTSSGVQTYSVYAKSGTYDWMYLRYRKSDLSYDGAYFDLSNGVLGAVFSTISQTIESIGSGWYRCSITFNASLSQVLIYPVDSNNGIANSGTGNIYIQDAQLEYGLVATDYIETTTSSVAVGITNNIPRINYENGIGNFLLEPQRTNNITYSEDFSQWSKLNSTVTSNSIDSPEGNQNAALINYSITSSNGYVRLAHTASQYITVYVKYNDIQWLMCYGSGLGAGKFIDIKNGVIGGNVGSGANAEIYDAGNGWKRIHFYSSSANITQFSIYAAESDGSYASITLSGSVYLWGAQAETGSYPTSYIPTYGGSAVTRAAETCNNAGNSDLFNDSEGVLYAEISALADDGTNRYISLSDGSISNRVNIFFDTNNKIRGFYNGLSGSISIDKDITIQNKIAFKYKSGDSAFWVNGFEMATRTDALSLSGLDSVSFDLGGGSDFYGKTKMVSTFTEALSDSELECLTSWSSFNRMATAQNYTIQ